ncbi:MAG: PHP domain-containing protein [Bacillota bacterium]|jgi:predicted metal-dependent phosphoesterase TrpH
MAFADLHLHSTASDGNLSPRDLVGMAKAKGFAVVALTDHDTTQGLDEALTAGRDLSIQVVPGIELSTETQGQEVHILGYYIDHGDAALQQVLSQLKQARAKRIKEMVSRLQQLGFTLTWEEVREAARGASSIGRPHVAQVMVEKGHAGSMAEVFANWIGPDRPAFVPRYKLSPARAVEIIHSAGGLAFLAHPGLLTGGIEWVENLLALPLDGIEVYHSEHSEAQTKEFLALARANNLHISGGSDCHGRPHEIKMGLVKMDTVLIQSWLKA